MMLTYCLLLQTSSSSNTAQFAFVERAQSAANKVAYVASRPLAINSAGALVRWRLGAKRSWIRKVPIRDAVSNERMTYETSLLEIEIVTTIVQAHFEFACDKVRL